MGNTMVQDQNNTITPRPFFPLEVAEQNATTGSVHVHDYIKVSKDATVGDVYRIATGMLPTGIILGVSIRGKNMAPTSTQLFSTLMSSMGGDRVVVLFRDAAPALRAPEADTASFGGKSARRRRSRSIKRKPRYQYKA